MAEDKTKTPGVVRQGEIVTSIDQLFAELIAGRSDERRALAFALYEAALAVAVHGRDQVTAELAKRATSWQAGRRKRQSDERLRAWTRNAVIHSGKPKNREPASGAETAFEAVAKDLGISPATAEKRRYRKPPG